MSTLLAQEVKERSQYQRFNIHHRIQHIMMFTSFIICTVTGLPIKFSSTGWAVWMTRLFGGFDNLLTTHLVGAAIMLACSAYHLIYLVLYPLVKRKVSLATIPTPKDVRDLVENLQFMLGLREKPAQFARYSYKEKFDYWAVFWGMAIMGGSGLMMWFPGWAAQYMPRWIIDSARYAHSDEAMLAILAIFVWHFFNVHFSPTFFPMNFVWWHGKMSRELMEEEHPLELEELEGRAGAPGRERPGAAVKGGGRAEQRQV